MNAPVAILFGLLVGFMPEAMGRKCKLSTSTSFFDATEYSCNPSEIEITLADPGSTEGDCDDPMGCHFEWTVVAEGVTCPNITVYHGTSQGTQSGNDWTVTGVSDVPCSPATDNYVEGTIRVKNGSGVVLGGGRVKFICKKCT